MGFSAPGPRRFTWSWILINACGLVTKIKNGSVSFAVTTDVPPNPTPQAAGCPNGQWTAAFNNVTFGSGTLTVKQDDGTGFFATVLTTNVTLPKLFLTVLVTCGG